VSVRGWAVIDGERIIPKEVRDPPPLEDQAEFIAQLRRQVKADIETLRKAPDVYELLWTKPRAVSLDTIKL